MKNYYEIVTCLNFEWKSYKVCVHVPYPIIYNPTSPNFAYILIQAKMIFSGEHSYALKWKHFEICGEKNCHHYKASYFWKDMAFILGMK